MKYFWNKGYKIAGIRAYYIVLAVNLFTFSAILLMRGGQKCIFINSFAKYLWDAYYVPKFFPVLMIE